MERTKILLADDNEMFRRTLATYLKRQDGVDVVGEACDGSEVVELAQCLHPDLVLIDMNMPNQNGLEAAKAIKARLPRTRIIILSWNNGEVYRRMATQYSADYFIDKASIKTALLAIICTVRAHTESNAVGILAA